MAVAAGAGRGAWRGAALEQLEVVSRTATAVNTARIQARVPDLPRWSNDRWIISYGMIANRYPRRARRGSSIRRRGGRPAGPFACVATLFDADLVRKRADGRAEVLVENVCDHLAGEVAGDGKAQIS